MNWEQSSYSEHWLKLHLMPFFRKLCLAHGFKILHLMSDFKMPSFIIFDSQVKRPTSYRVTVVPIFQLFLIPFLVGSKR